MSQPNLLLLHVEPWTSNIIRFWSSSDRQQGLLAVFL